MSKNPFHLKRTANSGGAPADKLYKPLSEEEQREKLVGYVSIPKHGWQYIQFNTHIRYIETEAKGGKFKSGGFVASNSMKSEEHGRKIKLKNSLFKNANNYMEWLVNYSDIEFMYSKTTGVGFALQQDIKAIAAALLSELKELKKRVAYLESR